MTEALKALYRQALGREADESGLASFSSRLEAGESFDQIRMEIGTSPEGTRYALGLGAGRLPTMRSPSRFVGIGNRCIAAGLLVAADLRRAPSPFAWIRSSPQMVAECMADDFRTFLDPQHHVAVGPNLSTHSLYERLYEQDGPIFAHADVTEPSERKNMICTVDSFRRFRRSPGVALYVDATLRHNRAFAKAGFDAMTLAAAEWQLQVLMIHVEEPAVLPDHECESEGRHRLIYFRPSSRPGLLGFESALDDLYLLQLIAAYAREPERKAKASMGLAEVVGRSRRAARAASASSSTSFDLPDRQPGFS